MKLRAVTLLCILTFFAKGQHFEKAMAINPLDTSALTSTCISPEGEMYTASLRSRSSSAHALPGQPRVGEIALRKLGNSGLPLWEVILEHSKGIVFHSQLFQGDKWLISGAYYDSLSFDQNNTIYALDPRANAFIACYDTAGEFLWEAHTSPHVHYDKFYYTFDDKNNQIYIPYYNSFTLEERIQVLDHKGDSINNFQLSNKIMMISEFEFTDQGALYFSATCDPQARVSGSVLGNDSTMFGYATVLVKVDTSFQHLWSKKQRYVTLDMYSKMAFNEDRVAWMVDTMPQLNGIGNYHEVRIFDHQGNLQHSDSIGSGFFSRMHQAISLVSFNEHFIYGTIKGFDTTSIMKMDSNYQHVQLATVRWGITPNYPNMVSNDSLVYFGHSYTAPEAVVNNKDTIVNPKYGGSVYGYQQLLMKFKEVDPTISIESPGIFDGIAVFPNPVKDDKLYVKMNTTEHIQTVCIYDLSGRQMKLPIAMNEDRIEISVQGLMPAVYLIRIETNKESFVQRWQRL